MAAKIKNVEDLTGTLDSFKKEYHNKVFNLIDQIFNDHLKDICDNQGFAFLTGNGQFLFRDNESGKTYELDEIPDCLKVPQKIKDIFMSYMESYGFPCDNVGSLCKNYNE